jgi:hypothetical protein
VLAVPALGADPAELTPWQAYFRRCAADYRLEVGDKESVAELRKEPVLKWSQPVRGGDDGALFVWLADGRPAVIGTFFIWPNRDGRFGVSHELHRLTLEELKGDWRQTVRWRPAKDDLAWQPVPDVDAASPDKAKRATQARQIARRFSATSKNREGGTSELRLQPRPFFEYVAAEVKATEGKSDWLGGSLFSLAHGTDTEIVLWLEARGEGSAIRWHFALARMSDLELHPRLDDKELPIGEFTSYDDFASPYLCTAPEFMSEPPAETK